MREKIKDFYKNQKFARITRKVAEDWDELSRGYIVDFSNDFVVIQECDDFRLLGFNILPIKDFKQIRYNNNDKYYDKIMLLENEKKNIGIKTKVDLTNWKSIFQSLRKKKKNVVVECENPKIDSFTIGPIKRITDKSVFIQYFNATGFLDEKPTKIEFKNISKIMFDDRYVDIFSKYTRERKKKKTTANNV
ncbi:hypothetical protein [Winogradskyella alexanderae]|uniref:Uncharacterized protein n=1 Tax=Winogradskyella alexanderae TaxID=2877123 RepID=A0ABS7XVU8_9FLAO|nr:hypothetical protein [Winogradskyella alexanderae]MCA0133890.1 hypothetical protein [Winogradskyella alexanderae]